MRIFWFHQSLTEYKRTATCIGSSTTNCPTNCYNMQCLISMPIKKTLTEHISNKQENSRITWATVWAHRILAFKGYGEKMEIQLSLVDLKLFCHWSILAHSHTVVSQHSSDKAFQSCVITTEETRKVNKTFVNPQQCFCLITSRT